MDPQLVALANFIIQVVLMGVVAFSSYWSFRRKKLKFHCKLMRYTVGVLIVTIAVTMVPQLIGFIGVMGVKFSWFYAETLLHHTLGLAIIGIFVYSNLVMLRIIKTKRRQRTIMRVVTGLWAAVFIMGVHMYVLMGV